MFFFNDTATTEIYTLSLHDALPICVRCTGSCLNTRPAGVSRVPFSARKRATSGGQRGSTERRDRKSTRLNSSHANISYAVFCLNNKKYCDCKWNNLQHSCIIPST